MLQIIMNIIVLDQCWVMHALVVTDVQLKLGFLRGEKKKKFLNYLNRILQFHWLYEIVSKGRVIVGHAMEILTRDHNKTQHLGRAVLGSRARFPSRDHRATDSKPAFMFS